MKNVLYTVSVFWFMFYLSGFWLTCKRKDFQDAGLGLLVITSLFGINSYFSNKISTWDWWQQAWVISTVLGCYLAGIASYHLFQTKT